MDEHECRFLNMIRTPVKDKESELLKQAGKKVKYVTLSRRLTLRLSIPTRGWT